MGFSKSQMPKIFGEALGFMQSSVKWYLFLLPIRNRQIQRSFIVYYFRTTERTKYYWLLLLIVIAFISERPMMMCWHLGTLWFHFVYFHRYYINLVKSWVEGEWFVRNFWHEWFGKPHTHISDLTVFTLLKTTKGGKTCDVKTLQVTVKLKFTLQNDLTISSLPFY